MKLKVSYGPFFCVQPILYGHWQFACAHENRAQISCDVCAVGRFFLALFKKFNLFKKLISIHHPEGTILPVS